MKTRAGTLAEEVRCAYAVREEANGELCADADRNVKGELCVDADSFIWL